MALAEDRQIPEEDGALLLQWIQMGELEEWAKRRSIDFSTSSAEPYLSWLAGRQVDGRRPWDKQRISIVGPHSLTELGNCHWSGVSFVNCRFAVNDTRTFKDCTFESCQFYPSPSYYGGGDPQMFFSDCERVHNCDISAMLQINAERTCFSLCQFEHDRPTTLELAAAQFERCRFHMPEMNRSTFRNVEFNDCKIRITRFHSTDWSSVTFRNSSMESDAAFTECIFADITVDDQFLESLGPDRGQLRGSELSRFTVQSPITEMRLLFGGWMATIHWIAVTLFVIPYVMFTVEKFWGPLPSFPIPDIDVAAIADPAMQREIIGKLETTADPQKMPDRVLFGSALWDFIRYGNREPVDRTLLIATYRISTFVIFFIYNLCRLLFLLKVKSLEHAHAVQGFWPQFDFSLMVHARFLRVTWGRLKGFATIGTWIAVLCGFAHFVELLQKPVLP